MPTDKLLNTTQFFMWKAKLVFDDFCMDIFHTFKCHCRIGINISLLLWKTARVNNYRYNYQQFRVKYLLLPIDGIITFGYVEQLRIFAGGGMLSCYIKSHEILCPEKYNKKHIDKNRFSQRCYGDHCTGCDICMWELKFNFSHTYVFQIYKLQLNMCRKYSYYHSNSISVPHIFHPLSIYS